VTAARASLRRRARGDVDAIALYYIESGAPDAAEAFIDALQKALRRLCAHPRMGSPMLGTELGIPGLRTWPLKGFPYLVCYVHRDDVVDVWRVLHFHRDIPEGLMG
jgi:toxin ParE1/3/4